MDLREFKLNYKGAPFSEAELAEAVCRHLEPESEEGEELLEAAEEFLLAKDTFGMAIAKADLQRG